MKRISYCKANYRYELTDNLIIFYEVNSKESLFIVELHKDIIVSNTLLREFICVYNQGTHNGYDKHEDDSDMLGGW